MKHKVIFIGAGLGNILAANMLADNSFSDFIILEKGKSIDGRFCPGLKDKKCTFCSSGCSILEGIGGANALNGNKLCFFPASCNVLKFTENLLVGGFYNYLKSRLPEGFEIDYNSSTNFLPNSKSYFSDAYNKDQFNHLVKILSKTIGSKIYREDILSISNKNEVFQITTKSGKNYYGDYVIIGSGRSSFKLLENLYKQECVKFKNNKLDLGIRIETHKDNFTDTYLYQVDPKFKFTFGKAGSGRTFCAHNQGKVIPVRFGNAFYADGAFGEHFTDQSNIALMVRSTRSLDTDQLENWCHQINSKTGSLILGHVEITGESDRIKMIEEIMSLIKMPDNVYKDLLNQLLTNLLTGEYNILKYNPEQSNKLTIYGPAIDQYWPQPELNSDFSIDNNHSLFVIGDAAGLSRGFIQSMYSGYAWANYFINNFGDNTIDQSETKEWLSLELPVIP